MNRRGFYIQVPPNPNIISAFSVFGARNHLDLLTLQFISQTVRQIFQCVAVVRLSPCFTFKNVSIVLQVVLEHFSFVFKEDLCEKYDWDAELEDLSESVWASSVQITTVL